MPIRVLTEDEISQIAAGEVVERPASVVKELLENALDAGARTVGVEVEAGGRKLIRVSDDGVGIPAAEVGLAFARHATSKLASAEVLFRVATLGFRGEALASIAAVSRVTLVSRAADEAAGAQVRVEAGEVRSRATVGAPRGVIVTVENLFFNVPARLKFLKSEASERGHITALVTRYALAYPRVRFRLQFDGRPTFQSAGDGDVRAVLAEVYGVEIARQMLEILPAREAGGATPAADDDAEDEWPRILHEPALSGASRAAARSMQVSGFISPPALNRSNRKEITLFVNGRWALDTRLTAAVTQAYHAMLMVGRYPIAVIMLALPAEEVDVNVHPAKAEVRFRDADAAFSAVQRAVRRTLVERAPVPEFEPRRWTDSSRQPSVIGRQSSDVSRQPSASGYQPPVSGQPQPSMPTPEIPLLRVIGQVGAAYIVAEGPDGLYLIDQHAAHERVLYEQFSLMRASAEVVSQALLEPVAVELTPEAAAQLEGQLATLNALGFSVEPFGGSTFLVRALPSVVGGLDPARALRVVVEEFEEDETLLAAAVEARLIARVCKRAAVKAGQVLSAQEQVELVRRLERTTSPRTCPHGRPTMIHLSVETLEKQFGRR